MTPYPHKSLATPGRTSWQCSDGRRPSSSPPAPSSAPELSDARTVREPEEPAPTPAPAPASATVSVHRVPSSPSWRPRARPRGSCSPRHARHDWREGRAGRRRGSSAKLLSMRAAPAPATTSAAPAPPWRTFNDCWRNSTPRRENHARRSASLLYPEFVPPRKLRFFRRVDVSCRDPDINSGDERRASSHVHRRTDSALARIAKPPDRIFYRLRGGFVARRCPRMPARTNFLTARAEPRETRGLARFTRPRERLKTTLRVLSADFTPLTPLAGTSTSRRRRDARVCAKTKPATSYCNIALARQEPRRRTPTSALDTRPPLGTHASFISVPTCRAVAHGLFELHA